MVWSKLKQNLESFICPGLVDRVQYSATGYRYRQDKTGQCYIKVDKIEIFNMNLGTTMVQWYQTEQEIKKDLEKKISVSQEDVERIRKEYDGRVPEDRLIIIAKERIILEYAKEIMVAQTTLGKSDFYAVAHQFLSDSIEESLNSKDILINVLALVDRRIGKKRLQIMEDMMKLKHPIVQYFYMLRRANM